MKKTGFPNKIRLIIWVVIGLLTLSAPGLARADYLLDELEEAYEAHIKAEYDKAIEHYTSLIESEELLMANLSITHLLRGQAWAGKGDCDKAVEDFNSAIELRQDYAHAFYFRSECFEKQEKYFKAWEDIERALLFKPDKHIYREAKILLMTVMGKDENAVYEKDPDVIRLKEEQVRAEREKARKEY